jgi:hypothetical protein
MSNPSLTLGDLSSKIRRLETEVCKGYTVTLSIKFSHDTWLLQAKIFNPDRGLGKIFEGCGLWLDIAARSLFNQLDSLTTKDFPQ